jgi:hypothetical protein
MMEIKLPVSALDSPRSRWYVDPLRPGRGRLRVRHGVLPTLSPPTHMLGVLLSLFRHD